MAQDFKTQEVRFALVMTGGVSLAVWMGGAAYEFYRMLRSTEQGDSQIYGQLLELTQSTASVDVIAGTSAGGLNGVLLASALLAGTSVEDFKTLRDTWMDTGDIVNLLRDSSDRSATSLLKGDGYFLPSIQGIIERLTKGNLDGSNRTEPLDLVVPATLLTPDINCLADDYGHQFTETDYHAYFRFGWGEGAYYSTPKGDAIDKLALAARTSASFPFAFEPSFVPGGDAKKSLGDNVSTTRSRFMVDGGILDNKPLGHALDVISTRRAAGTVRRVLAYFAPSVESDKDHPADKRRNPPSLSSVLSAAVISIRANETITADLRRLREHNERVTDQQRRRALIVKGTDSLGLGETANLLIGTQMLLHAYGAARILVRRLDRRMSEILTESDRERLIEALAVQRKSILEKRHTDNRGRDIGTPINPPVLDRLDRDIHDPAKKPRCTLQRLYLSTRKRSKEELWPWGLFAVQYVTETATSVIRRAMLAVPARDENLELLGRLGEFKEQLHFLRLTIFRLKDLDRAFWDAEFDRLAREGLDDDLNAWASRCFNAWPKPESPPSNWNTALERLRDHAGVGNDFNALALSEAIAYNAAALLRAAMADCALAVESSSANADDNEELRDEVSYFNVAESERGESRATEIVEMLRRMVSVFIVQSSFNVLTVSEHPVDFLLVSADTVSPLGGTRTATDKLAGMQLANFAGFIKRSWRANDWMWGRLDAADRIIRALCDPSRIKRNAVNAEVAWAAIQEMVEPIWDHCDKAQRDLARAEIYNLYASTGPVPNQLPETAKLLSEAQQRLIAAEELPQVAAAIAESERDEKASAAGAALRFAKQVRDTTPDKLTAEAKPLVEKLRIGEEQWRGEAGSDHFTRVASHATMVFANLASNPKTNLSMMGRAVDKAQSGITALFLLAQLTVRRSRTTFALTLLAMLASGLVLTFEYGPALDDLRPARLLVTLAWLTVVAVVVVLLFYRYGVAALTVLTLGGLMVAAIITGRQGVVDALAWCCATEPRASWAETAAGVAFSAAALTALSDRGHSSGWWTLGAVIGFLAGVAMPVLADSQVVTGLGGAVLGGSIAAALHSGAIPPIAKRTLVFAAIGALGTWGGLWVLARLVDALSADTGFWAEQVDELHERREAWTVALVPLFITLVAFLRFGRPFSQTKAGQLWRRWFGYA